MVVRRRGRCGRRCMCSSLVARRSRALGCPRRPRRPGRLRLARRRGDCAVVAAAWMVPTLGSLAGGMDRADSLWYHMPLAPGSRDGSHFGDDRLLRPDLLRLVLPGELRGPARGPAARLRPRHPLAAAQPRLARARPARRPTAIGRPYGVGPQSADRRRRSPSAPRTWSSSRRARRSTTSSASRCVLAAVAILVNALGGRPRRIGGDTVAGRRNSSDIAAAGDRDRRASPPASRRAPSSRFLAPVIALFVGVIVIAGARRAGPYRSLVRAPGARSRAATGTCATRSRSATRSPTRSFGPLGLPTPERTLRAAARLLGLSLRDRHRRLEGLVLPRARRLVRLSVAADPGRVRRWRRLRALARARARCCGCSAPSCC